jgi:lactoylglutathione lyase
MAKIKTVGPISDEDTNALPVKDLAPALTFYETVLGFSVVSRDATTSTVARDEVRDRVNY